MIVLMSVSPNPFFGTFNCCLTKQLLHVINDTILVEDTIIIIVLSLGAYPSI